MESINDKDLEIIKLRKSNLRLKITIGVLIISIALLFVYSFVQQGIALEMKRVAIEQEQKAIKAAEEALKQQKLAEAGTIEAMKQHQRAEEALKKIPKK